MAASRRASFATSHVHSHVAVGRSAALAVVAVAALSGCGAPPKRLELVRPGAGPGAAIPAAAVAAQVRADELREDDAQLRFDARSDRIRVTITNLSKEDVLAVAWDRAFYIDPAGKKHAVIGYDEPRTSLLRAAAPLLQVPPGGTWSGRVHPRDRIRPPSGGRFFEVDLISEDEVRAGDTVGLDLPVDIGRKAFYHELRFRVTADEAPSE